MNTTPDLSKEFHPVPKTFKAKKTARKLGAGKKTKSWEEGRAQLKEMFRDQGITTCEIQRPNCKKDNFLGFAHTRPRNTLTQEQTIDPHFVVLACVVCHEYVDLKITADKAAHMLDKIVQLRGW